MIDQASGLRELASAFMKPATVITVTSGKGGVGKSSVALNVAIALSRRGRRVLIIDTDFGFSNIDVMLGVGTKHDLLDVIKNNMDIRDIIEQGIEGVQFISGGSGVYELTQLSGGQLMGIVNNLKNLEDVADTIIFDTGPGVSENNLRLICASHKTLMITTPEPTSVVDAYALIKIVGERGSSMDVSLIVNKADSPAEAASVTDCLARISERNVGVAVERFGFVLRDPNMQKAIRMQVPVLVSFPGCTASLNIDGIAAKLTQSPAQQPEGRGLKGFLERFLTKSAAFSG